MEGSKRYVPTSEYKSSPTFYIRSIADRVPARVTLYMLSFTGFVVSFMMRMDINIAMVSMVKFQEENSNKNETFVPICKIVQNSTLQAINSTNMDEVPKNEGEFDWSPAIQSTIIGIFFWFYVLSQIIGGLLTQYFGPKTVFGGSQLLTAICSLLIPTAAEIHYSLLIVLRSIQGIASGITWPAMYAMVGIWIPTVERSRFMSSFQGFSFGIGVTYPLGGFIIAHFGWRYVFYTTGTIGVIWCIFWYFFAFDSPSTHPRITPDEYQYIQGSIGQEVSQGMKTPWKSILTSMPAWSIGITTFGRIWVHYVFIVYGPVYMKTVLGFSIEANGVLSGAPFICSYFSSVIFCYIADQLVKYDILSLTNLRKVFTVLSQVVPGILVIFIGYLGCNIILALIVWFIAVTFVTAAYAGAMANIVDIAPNFAGPVLAFAQTIHMSASFLSPIVAGLLIQQSQAQDDAWRNVFAVTACVACGTYVIYQIFGTADVQAWNYRDQKYPNQTVIQDDSQPLNDSSPRKTQIVINSQNNHSDHV